MPTIREAVIAALVVIGLQLTVISADKPNILVIWGDDIGTHNISAYNHGIMGYKTPNIDRLASEGGMFIHYYAQNSCTAGRAAFMMGQHPFRTGMLTIGMPGSAHGIPEWTPTIADLLKEEGYMTAQFGKNHFGDRDSHLPTAHGFDEFYGNLYHLNAEEEPESYYYPKDPSFRKKFGPRGVIKSTSDGKIEDTGPLTKKRMETADDEFMNASLDFIERAHKADKPFFIWHNSTRMHVWTHLRKSAVGRTGIGLYPDGMVEHDDQVGTLLKKLDDLGIADNTIVMYSTDNGAEKVSWPDGGITPFHGEKGTTWEGGFRVPCIVKWPKHVKGGSKFTDIVSHEDWMPTFLAAAGVKNLPAKLKKGHKANGKNFRVHLDGYDMSDYLAGKSQSPRETIFFFAATGELNAVRWKDWKAHFAIQEGAINEASRVVTAWPRIYNLKADPYEEMAQESGMYLKWYAENTMWLFVPIQMKVKEFLGSLEGYPFQPGSSLSASNINYNSLKMQKLIKKMETMGGER